MNPPLAALLANVPDNVGVQGRWIEFNTGPDRQISDVASLNVHRHDTRVRWLRHRAAIFQGLLRRAAVRDDPSAVRGPFRAATEPAVRRQALQAGPTGV